MDITKLEKYVYDVYIEGKPRNYLEKDLFEQESYSKFFAKMILKEGKLYKSFTMYLEDLIDELSDYMTRSKNLRQDWIFAVGYDVALDILDFVLVEEERYKNGIY